MRIRIKYGAYSNKCKPKTVRDCRKVKLKKHMGHVRITGGLHRSRRIAVEDQPGLRPSSDRVRETLFNWLGHNLTGFEVLDLYAGSGILSFEAASRNAQRVIAIDNNPKAIKQLEKNLSLIGIDTINVIKTDAKKYIRDCQHQFDLIYLDPPFESNELATISGIIAPLVKLGGYLYREFGSTQEVSSMNEANWTLLKTKKAGQVLFELWQKH